jgi:DNA-binding beta-propeller fold protein YncE
MIVRVLILSCVLLAACTSPEPVTQQDIQEATMVWPSPPEAARIRFLRAFGKPEDLGIRRSGFRKLMDAVAGAKDSGMIRPYAVAVSGQKVMVCDPGLHAVHLFDPAGRSYQLITSAGKEPLSSPVGAALGEERMFVADSVLGKIFILDDEGKLLGTITGLERPTGLAWDASGGRLYAADTLAHRIVVFDGDGRQLFEFGTRGIGEGEFNFPSHISLSAGRLLVNDNMNFRVQAFDTQGRFLSSFGHHGDGSGHFSQPKGVSADSKGHVYVAGATIDRVQVFTPDGEFLLAFGSKGSGAGQFLMPAGVTIYNDRIYVADSYNSRIQVFQYVGND